MMERRSKSWCSRGTLVCSVMFIIFMKMVFEQAGLSKNSSSPSSLHFNEKSVSESRTNGSSRKNVTASDTDSIEQEAHSYWNGIGKNHTREVLANGIKNLLPESVVSSYVKSTQERANASTLQGQIFGDDSSGAEEDFEEEEEEEEEEEAEIPTNRNVDMGTTSLGKEAQVLRKDEFLLKPEFPEGTATSMDLSVTSHSHSTEEESLSSSEVSISSQTPLVDGLSPPTNVASFVDREVNSSMVPRDLAQRTDNNLKQYDTTVSPNSRHRRRGKKSLKTMSISEINTLFLHHLLQSKSVNQRWHSTVDKELRQAKFQILNAAVSTSNPLLYAPLYRNLSMFTLSYELMEKMLKVYIYEEGEKPFMHQPILSGIYASEGWFMKQLESSKQFVTKKSQEAHLFYLPFSSNNLRFDQQLNHSTTKQSIRLYLSRYMDIITTKYPFWNRTDGTDHFLVACHDWAPKVTKQRMARCIRSLCNSNAIEDFSLGKDVSLPQAHVGPAGNLLRHIGGNPASHRSILAFFAGRMHGYLRPILLQHWGEGKDPRMKIFGKMRNTRSGMTGYENYLYHMKRSKYCICARGYGVNSPRVVESILYECVPVIVSDNYVPPFFSTLNWESFAVFVPEKDIPNLKKILLQIPEERYLQLHMGVKRVQRHFMWNPKPVKYDAFHMILHSIWFSRVLSA